MDRDAITEKKLKLPKKWTGVIKVGDWYSYTNYVKVLEINKNSLKIVDVKNKEMEVSKEVLYNY